MTELVPTFRSSSRREEQRGQKRAERKKKYWNHARARNRTPLELVPLASRVSFDVFCFFPVVRFDVLFLPRVSFNHMSFDVRIFLCLTLDRVTPRTALGTPGVHDSRRQ